MQCKLSELLPGEAGKITCVMLPGPMRRRVQDLGFVPGTTVRALLRSFGGGITAYGVQESLIALRRSDAVQIIINK